VLSFIIPAHNEEQLLGPTLRALAASARGVGEPFEVIVVDDASTDQTAAIALELGARVVHVQNRQIAATRNAGAREASGDLLFFVDADTLANEDAVRAAVEALREGAAGGGCVFDFDGELPLWLRAAHPALIALFRLLNVTGGCFLFCTREAFDAIGGFCERYFAVEDRPFIAALKRQGRFVVPRARVKTSGRKAREVPFWRAMWLIARMAAGGPESFSRREASEAWYGSRRDRP